LSFNELVPAMRQSRLVQECTPAALGARDFAVRTFMDSKIQGRQTLAVAGRSGGIAVLSMAWNGIRQTGPFDDNGWMAGSGRLLSCGGLFTLAAREQRADPADTQVLPSVDVYRQDRLNRRFEVVQISDYHGRLFPLQVGNELSFSYAFLLQEPSVPGPLIERRDRLVRYRVLSANDAFRIDGAIVPGRVFLLEQIVSTAGGEAISTRDLYYSTVYGWVVMAVEYDNGMPGTVVQMTAGR
ncbi:MAG: hypothetical protein R3308_02985, partial [Thiohalobacterales bacterium]|nr:hypothetical protein [Thiohalobacterales bacterium]